MFSLIYCVAAGCRNPIMENEAHVRVINGETGYVCEEHKNVGSEPCDCNARTGKRHDIGCATRSSKVGKAPCVHLENRWNGHCQRCGVDMYPELSVK